MIPLAASEQVKVVQEGEELSFAESLLREGQDRKRLRTAMSKYRRTNHINATSNICERLFSAARLIMNHLRGHMDPSSCEMLLFLKLNRDLWESPRIIDEIIRDEKLAGRLIPDDDGEEA